METLEEIIPQTNTWTQKANLLGEAFEKRSAEYDRTDSFVKENYEDLKSNKFLKAMIPTELGGGGISHDEMCSILKTIAYYDGSTALALSMHQHLLAATIWRYKNGKGGEEMLKKVAEKDLVLISTGAKDWLESNGSMEKVKDGYLVSGRKEFASQSAIGDILVTSAPFNDPINGWQVLHFAVPMSAEGVSKIDNWYAMGMRGTGSLTVQLDKVFVPESAIVLRRPKGEFHPFWNVVITVALPLIMSVYVGIAERAADIALEQVKEKHSDPLIPSLVGEINNELTAAQVLLKDMVTFANNMNFEPKDEFGQAVFTRKTLVANACIRTVEKCMHTVGGKSYYRELTLERLFRDVQASNYHVLTERQQEHFSGEFLLKKGL